METSKVDIKTHARPTCLLCDCRGRTLYAELADSLFNAPGIWNLKQCENTDCGLIWLDPSPIEAELPRLYQSYFFSDRASGQQLPFSQRLRAILYRVYRIAGYLPSALLGLREAQREMHCLYLSELPPGKLLDVGCGDGTFLHRMQSKGWKVDGLDFDANAIESARTRYGLNLRRGDLAGAHLPEDTFDAVTMNHVIEHVPDPLAMLRATRRVLKPGGRLVVVTPNSLSLGHKSFQAHWVNLDPPRHLQIFTPNALRASAVRAGLKVVAFQSSAANADNFIGASHGVRKFYSNRSRKKPASQINVIRALRSLLFQYRESVLLRRDPDIGEEAVLICTK